MLNVFLKYSVVDVYLRKGLEQNLSLTMANCNREFTGLNYGICQIVILIHWGIRKSNYTYKFILNSKFTVVKF